MSSHPPLRAELVRQADAVATIIAIVSGSYGVLLSLLYEPFGSADLFSFEAARWSAWLNIAAALNAIAFMVGHRFATRAAIRRGGNPQRAFDDVATAGLVVSMLISVGHVHIGGSQSTILPISGMILAALATWFLPWSRVLWLTGLWWVDYLTMVALEATGVLPYAPIFQDSSPLVPMYLDWRSLVGMSILLAMLFGTWVLLLRAFHGPLHARRAALEQEVEARTEALRAANDSLDHRLEELQLTPAEQRVKSAEEQRQRVAIEARLRHDAVAALTAAAAGRVEQRLVEARNRARSASRALEAGPDGPRIARSALDDLVGALDSAGDALAELNQAARHGQRPPPGRLAVSLDDLARATAGYLRPDAAEREIRVQLELGRTPPVEVDRAAMEQAVFAVMHNALQAVADQRRQRVILRTRVDPRMVVLEVHDSGPGLPAEDVFEAGVGRWGRAGMGLTLARAAVQAHGGTLTGGPSPHGGAVIRLALPRPDPS